MVVLVRLLLTSPPVHDPQSHGTHCTEKTGKMVPKKIPSGKTQGIWKFCQNTGKMRGIWFAQVVNSLILKVRYISIFAAKISKFFLKLDKSA